MRNPCECFDRSHVNVLRAQFDAAHQLGRANNSADAVAIVWPSLHRLSDLRHAVDVTPGGFRSQLASSDNPFGISLFNFT